MSNSFDQLDATLEKLEATLLTEQKKIKATLAEASDSLRHTLDQDDRPFEIHTTLLVPPPSKGRPPVEVPKTTPPLQKPAPEPLRPVQTPLPQVSTVVSHTATPEPKKEVFIHTTPTPVIPVSTHIPAASPTPVPLISDTLPTPPPPKKPAIAPPPVNTPPPISEEPALSIKKASAEEAEQHYNERQKKLEDLLKSKGDTI